MDSDGKPSAKLESSCSGEDVAIGLQPTNACQFAQALNAARSSGSGSVAACADLLTSTAPKMLPQFLSNQLDAQSFSFIVQALDSHLLEKDPDLVYQHLNHLHTADRFSVRRKLSTRCDAVIFYTVVTDRGQTRTDKKTPSVTSL